jgi:hypothetical protein
VGLLRSFIDCWVLQHLIFASHIIYGYGVPLE